MPNTYIVRPNSKLLTLVYHIVYDADGEAPGYPQEGHLSRRGTEDQRRHQIEGWKYWP
jgi:hypothetical protein